MINDDDDCYYYLLPIRKIQSALVFALDHFVEPGQQLVEKGTLASAMGR